jgi:hypothetical protein
VEKVNRCKSCAWWDQRNGNRVGYTKLDAKSPESFSQFSRPVKVKSASSVPTQIKYNLSVEILVIVATSTKDSMVSQYTCFVTVVYQFEKIQRRCSSPGYNTVLLNMHKQTPTVCTNYRTLYLNYFKAQGLPLQTIFTPHHFFLTWNRVSEF